MKNRDKNILQFDGTPFENKKLFITFPPDIAFRLEVLAAKEGISTEKYILKVLKKHTDDNFSNKKEIYKLFE